MNSPKTDRRYFLKRFGISAAGVLGAASVGLVARDRGRDEPPPVPRGALPACARPDFRSGIEREPGLLAVGLGDPAAAAERAIALLGGMQRFVRPGETVVIKPNIGWDRTPAQAANTDPLVVAAVVSLCRKAGARRVVVTDNPCNEPRRCFTRSGIWKAAEAAGGEVVLPAPHRFEPCLLGGGILGRMPVLVPAVSADRFINLPVAKHHGLTGLSAGMKNLYGILGGRRNRLHQQVDESIADLTAFVAPTLTVVDATRVLVRNGPQGGSLSDIKAVGEVIACEDPVAIDAYACGLIGIAPDAVPYLALAEARGLGTADLSKVILKKGEG